MTINIEAISTLTERYQTTVPKTVRNALNLEKHDSIQYLIRPNGEVVLTRAAPPEQQDPALGAFLQFLATDITQHPERLQSIDAGLITRLRSLVGDVDLSAPLSPDDD